MEIYKKPGVRVKTSKNESEKPYMMFVEDCLIFYKTNKTMARKISTILGTYCTGSEQLAKVRYFKGITNT